MKPGKPPLPQPDGNVYPLLLRQERRLFYLYCYDCGLAFKAWYPAFMRLERMTCEGCGKRGFILWQTGRR